MSRRRLICHFSLVIFHFPLFLAAAEAPLVASSPSDNDGLTIAGSKEEQELARRDRHVDQYKRFLAGDSEARSWWNELKGPQRTTILSEVTLKDETSTERNHAIRELAAVKRSDDPENRAAVALARVACAEKSGDVRELAQTALTARRDDCTPLLLTAALAHPDADIHNNAVAALQAFGGPRIFEVIIEKWRESCGPGPRTHFFSGTQRSYIGDYDVAGAVYDPVIKSFLTGVVLDVKVQHIEGTSWHVWIREITGNEAAKLGNDIGAWQHWLEAQGPKLAEDAQKKTAAAIAALAKQ